MNNDVIESFGMTKSEDYNLVEGECFLKTKSDQFKKHWAILMGNELYCYRHKTDSKHRVMHSLAGAFIKELGSEELQKEPQSATSSSKQPLSTKNVTASVLSYGNNKVMYPIKVVLPPSKSRVLYFATLPE